jgi:hypothetical protein
MNSYKTRLVILLSIFLLISFSACDPAIGYEYHLNNFSDKDLKITFKAFGDYVRDDSTIVYSNTEKLFYSFDIWGKNPHDEKDDFLWMFDTLQISSTDSTKLLIDYLLRDNWTYSNDIGHLGFVKTGSNFYRLEISNEDFINKK